MRVPGVANVPIWGERIEMPTIQIDPERLREHNVTVDAVSTAVADALDAGLLQYSEGNYIGRGGFIDTATNRFQVQHVLPIVRGRGPRRHPGRVTRTARRSGSATSPISSGAPGRWSATPSSTTVRA